MASAPLRHAGLLLATLISSPQALAASSCDFRPPAAEIAGPYGGRMFLYATERDGLCLVRDDADADDGRVIYRANAVLEQFSGTPDTQLDTVGSRIEVEFEREEEGIWVRRQVAFGDGTLRISSRSGAFAPVQVRLSPGLRTEWFDDPDAGVVLEDFSGAAVLPGGSLRYASFDVWNDYLWEIDAMRAQLAPLE